jgi:hypothetical protein
MRLMLLVWIIMINVADTLLSFYCLLATDYWLLIHVFVFC